MPKITGILHSFNGSFDEGNDYINLGIYIGISGQYSMSCFLL